jgi:hypothetical protein
MSPEKYQMSVLISQEMVILNTRHHCNAGRKVVISLAGWTVEREAVQVSFGHLQILESIFKILISFKVLFGYTRANVKLMICNQY